ncbi:uncharacterized protein LOC131018780 [Salvia miltiorrhiza]|uniref:uncharacterized protein LOC131018780 n=1 Tax=Salvia miltiorrhiza TaxID=226208 RepID=UPI0025AC975B|nr:uncharacterized protein LOC131018780 [Salvia miltiorrhiza]
MDLLKYLGPKLRVLNIYIEGGERFVEGDNVIPHEISDEEFVEGSQEEGHEEGRVAQDDEDSEEDSDYAPSLEESDGEDKVDGLEEDELASRDEEYVQAMRNVAAKRKIFELLDYDIRTEQDLQYMGNVFEYESSDGEMDSSETNEDQIVVKPKMKKHVYDPKCNHKDLDLKLGLRFEDGWQCREAIKAWAIENHKFIHFKRVGNNQCEAFCRPFCPWKIYTSKVQGDGSFKIKSIGGIHNCPKAMNKKLVSSNLISRRYINIFRVRPQLSIPELNEDIWQRYSTRVAKDRLYRARQLAGDMVRGTVAEHYALIRRYIAENRRVDPEGRFELLLGENYVFKGLNMGYNALRKGFKEGCKPVIGLDGCHLKTYLGGILLCAVGKDGNNQMYPISREIVEIENESCWTWFLKCLCEDLGISDGNGWTFIISDQQKGLENAVSLLVPHSEHRNCACHVYMNWKKEHKGAILKNIFWRAVRSTYVQEYKLALEEMKKENIAAYQSFIQQDVKKFCKRRSSLILWSDRLRNLINDIEKVTNDVFCPAIRKKLEKVRYDNRHCMPLPALGGKFEIQVEADKFVVSVEGKSCTCRVWQLTGIPCIHAICAIQFMDLDPAVYVNEYYTVEKYKPEVPRFIVKPPTIRKMPSRPKTKRKRVVDEVDPINPNRLKRTGMCMTCNNCGQQGPNSRGSKNMTVVRPPQEKAKVGRPRTKPLPTREAVASNKAKRDRSKKKAAPTPANIPNIGSSPLQSQVTHVKRATTTRNEDGESTSRLATTQESAAAHEG